MTQPKFRTPRGTQTKIACDEGIASIGPGAGGICSGGWQEAPPGLWPEGNPDSIWAVKWEVAPTHGEAQYMARGSNRFTWFENYGTKSARVLAGKRVSLAFWLSSPGGCSVIPIIWRGNLDLAVEDRTPFPEISMQLWSGETQAVGTSPTRINFTMDLPQIPAGVKVDSTSYLGLGLDFPSPVGPEIHMGPYALYEVKPGEQDIQPIEEIPYWDEVLQCMASEIVQARPGFFRE